MKNIIFINGTMGVEKTVTSRELKKLLKFARNSLLLKDYQKILKMELGQKM